MRPYALHKLLWSLDAVCRSRGGKSRAPLRACVRDHVRRPAASDSETTSEAGGHRSLSGEGFPVRALRSQPVAGSVALALNVGLVHASQRLQVGNHYYLWALRLRATFILLPTRPPDQRAGQ